MEATKVAVGKVESRAVSLKILFRNSLSGNRCLVIAVQEIQRDRYAAASPPTMGPKNGIHA